MRPARQLQVEEANKHPRLLVLEAAMCLGRLSSERCKKTGYETDRTTF